jgi:hypothetical protein
MCFAPNIAGPLAPILVPQGGPGAVVDIFIYGTQGFSVAIVTNPLMAVSNTPVVASVQIISGNIVRVTTGSPAPADTIAGYDAQIQVVNACGNVDIIVHVDVVANLNPILTDCALAQLLWTPEAREPAVGDTLLAFTPAGCRALLPPDVCGTIQAFPPVAPTLATELATADCGLATVGDVLGLYDLCAALQAFPVALPGPLDTVFGQQAGVCSQFTIFDIAANVDICTLLQNLPNAVVQPTAAFYGQQAGQCFEFAVADLLALAGPPFLAPNGSCAAPSYSFAASPDSGMFYDPAGIGSVVIGDDNCVDSITIGASVAIRTNSVTRLTYTSAGEWNIGGVVGAAGEVITSAGPGLPPTWQPATGGLPDLYGENSAGFVAPTATGTLTFAIGSAANASGNFSIALGSDADFSGTGANATSDFSISIGTDANITPASDGAIAIGRGAAVTFGGTGIAIGQFAAAGPINAIAIGSAAVAGNDGSIAIGNSAVANNTESTAVGASAIQRGLGFAGGKNADGGVFGVAIGHTAIAGSVVIPNAVAIGINTSASGSASTAVGARSIASGDNAIAIGGSTNLDPNNTNATAARTVAIGYNTNATAADAVAIGTGAGVFGGNAGAIAIGNGSFVGVNAGEGVSIGDSSGISGSATRSVALGFFARVTTFRGIAIGETVICAGDSGIVIGSGGNGQAAGNVVIGDGAAVGNPGGTNAIVIGAGASTAFAAAIAIGPGVTNLATNSVEIGNSNTNKTRFSSTGAFSLVGTGAMFLLPNYVVLGLPTAANLGGFIYVTN